MACLSLPWGVPAPPAHQAPGRADSGAWERVGIVSVPTLNGAGCEGYARDSTGFLHLVRPSSADQAVPLDEALHTARVEAREYARDKRGERYARQRALSPLYPASMRHCRRKRFTTDGVTVAVSAEGGASFMGLASCNRRSGCEHCGPRLLARDAELVNALVAEHGFERTLMLTVTVRHWKRCALRELRQGVADAFRRMRQHRQWRAHPALSEATIVRSLEVTDGEHGWHPHLHVLLLLPKRVTADEREGLERFIAPLWRGCVGHVMGRDHLPTYEHGVSIEECHQADYLCKLGLEVADAGQSKRARNVKGRSYWQLARDWIEAGKHVDDELAARIREYLDGMRGAKVVTWSPGQKVHAEALAPAKELETREGALIYSEEWDRVRDARDEHGRDARAVILDAAERAAPGTVAAVVCDVVDGLLRRRGPP